MSILKCKSCGGDLDVKDGDKVVQCSYCGSYQTIPNEKDEQILKIYARGNLLRGQGEFDKAYSMFSQLLTSEHEEAETYWNLLLCKYGITYVDDYDGKKKPTINRMSMSSILDDDDYKKAISLSDVVAKQTYENEARTISKIQENIQKIISKEKPYDVFISYKETDEFGDRTRDSLLAQEIYDTLTSQGYRVFLSRVTLSKIIGKEYEPYIYSALYTSKMMLLVSTNVDYINSVWVKNEWSRFIDMMKTDKNKSLIPCYRDIDPYDLPKEIRNLQGLDMSKLGFVQDLKIGVEKILGSRKPQVKITKPIQQNKSPDFKVDFLLQRIEILITQENFEEAKAKIDVVLDLEPKNSLAYFYAFCCKYELNVFDELCLVNIINSGIKFESYVFDENIISMFKFFSADAKEKFEKYFLGTYLEIFKTIVFCTNLSFKDDSSFRDTIGAMFGNGGLERAYNFITDSLFDFVMLPFDTSDCIPLTFSKEFPHITEELTKVLGPLNSKSKYTHNFIRIYSKYLFTLNQSITFYNENSQGIHFFDSYMKVDSSDLIKYSDISYIWFEQNNEKLKSNLFICKTKNGETYTILGMFNYSSKANKIDSELDKNDFYLSNCLDLVADYNKYELKNNDFLVIDNSNNLSIGCLISPDCKKSILGTEEYNKIEKEVNDKINEKVLAKEEAKKEEERLETIRQINEYKKTKIASTATSMEATGFLLTIFNLIGVIISFIVDGAIWLKIFFIFALIASFVACILGFAIEKDNK